MKHPRAPAHLRTATKRWWAHIVEHFELDQHHLRQLQAAAEAWDRYQQARETLAEDGLVVQTADGGTKAHPCVAIERDSRLSFLRALRELDLDGAPDPDPRPPAAPRNRRKSR